MFGHSKSEEIPLLFLQVEVFDIRNFKWRPGPALHDIRSGATVITIDNKYILVAGGHDGPIQKSSVEVVTISFSWQ